AEPAADLVGHLKRFQGATAGALELVAEIGPGADQVGAAGGRSAQALDGGGAILGEHLPPGLELIPGPDLIAERGGPDLSGENGGLEAFAAVDLDGGLGEDLDEVILGEVPGLVLG